MKGKIFTSDPHRERFLVETTASFAPREPQCSNMIKVFPRHKLQRIDGFGGSFTEGAGVVYNSMTDTAKSTFLHWYFSEQEHHYSLARMPIQSCDFSLSNYEYISSVEDIKQGKLDFTRDKEHLIPLISDALCINPQMALMASPWSPPACMKTNNDMNGGGKLRSEYYADFAQLIIQYLLTYRRYGIRIQYLSIQNEPVAVKTWDSCLYSVEEETSFAVNYLRPLLEEQGMGDMEIYIWDHDKDGLVDWAEQAFSREENINGINGMAFHWYTGDHFAQVQYLSQCLPDKKLLFSEGCVPMETGDNVGIRHWHTYLHDMVGNFKAGCTGFIDWNLLLNSEGGPNHQGNLCEAPVQYDSKTDTLKRNHSWYGIGHFCRYVQPGARVTLSSSFDASLEEVAFANPDGGHVLVVYNRDACEKTCRVVIDDKETALALPANGASTLVWHETGE